MNKLGKVIEIRGIRGLFLAIFVACCLVTGFTVFPGFVAMHIWNLFTPYITDMPSMTLIHGVMLWAILFLVWFAFNGKLPSLHFGCQPVVMDEEEFKKFMERQISLQEEEIGKQLNEQLSQQLKTQEQPDDTTNKTEE